MPLKSKGKAKAKGKGGAGPVIADPNCSNGGRCIDVCIPANTSPNPPWPSTVSSR